MRRQDFIKLAKYTSDKLSSIFELDKLFSGRVIMKNDPMECDLHICDDKRSWDFTFFEHDDYHNSKFEIDNIFHLIHKEIYF